MKTPFPHFGSKHRVAADIWKRFGDPCHFFEPFAGTLGTLLGRSESTDVQRHEYVGDADCLITNFWRAAKLASPEDMAQLADWPSLQLDLEARMKWLKRQRVWLREGLRADPNWYDLECAAYFAWVQSVKVSRNGTSVILGRRTGVRRRNQDLTEYFTALHKRLTDVDIHYGNWTKLGNKATKIQRSDVAIFLDPPYPYSTGRRKDVYATESGEVAEHVHRWAVARALTHPKMKIALCGFAGQHRMPPEWEEVAWPSKFGKGRERIWFSPNCLRI